MRLDNVVSIILTVANAVAAVAAEPTVSGADIPRALADGKPWTAHMASGRTTQMTFLPDGTGVFNGPMRMSTTWRVDGDRLCVRMGMMPSSKCVTLRRSGAGFEGYEDAEFAFRLSR